MQEENKNEEIQNSTEGNVLMEEGEQKEKFIPEEGNSKLKFVALFVVAVLVGVVIKTQAAKTITTGFDDYKVSELKTDFDLKKEEPAVSKEGQDADNQQQDDAANTTTTETPAPSCEE